jgi:hypothetical protein
MNVLNLNVKYPINGTNIAPSTLSGFFISIYLPDARTYFFIDFETFFCYGWGCSVIGVDGVWMMIC